MAYIGNRDNVKSICWLVSTIVLYRILQLIYGHAQHSRFYVPISMEWWYWVRMSLGMCVFAKNRCFIPTNSMRFSVTRIHAHNSSLLSLSLCRWFCHIRDKISTKVKAHWIVDSKPSVFCCLRVVYFVLCNQVCLDA